ncbi:MAG: zinc ribbon domain-containing protein, partial [Cyanothece sp. SIO1E1]|nr:zinc ribbon domain-containing protein [Cyanothece sp. SIO1E1]
MIICPNCGYQNPDGAAQCEACYTPLPTMTTCVSCGASVQADASFCGQCGFDLRTASSTQAAATIGTPPPPLPSPPEVEIPDLL